MKKKIVKIGIIAVLTLALILSSFGALPFGDTFAKEFDVDFSSNKITAQAAETPPVWGGTGDVATTFAVGDGSKDTPFEISTGAELAFLAKQVNKVTDYSKGKFFKLTADIVLNDISNLANWGSVAPTNAWTPIGYDSKEFKGEFDGCGHTVSGIYMKVSAGAYFQGLFGQITATATVKNVGVINSYIKGDIQVGGVVGQNYGSIINCYNTGKVAGTTNVGGVVGYNNGSIINCYNTGAVTGTGHVGGVVGNNLSSAVSNGSVINCYNTGAVAGTTDVGGVVGYNTNGAVANCYFLTNKITIGGTLGAGNAVGTSTGTGTVTNCSPFGANKLLTTAGDTPLTTDNKALVTFGANADLLATLNLGVTAYNGANPAATQATEWVAGAGVYPTFKPSEKPTPPTPDPTPITPATKFAGGNGSKETPYLIGTPEELAYLAQLVNANNTTYNAAGVHYKLTANIVLNDTANWTDWENTPPAKVWIPIGNAPANPFLGVFDGADHAVSGIYIKGNGQGVGLFGVTSDPATVKNVGVKNSYIKGNLYVGGVVGQNHGTVTNCYNLGVVTAKGNNVGGVVGNNGGTVINCYNRGAVSGTTTNAGGVVGLNVGSVINCYNNGAVKGDNCVGGVVGSNFSSVVNCYNRGEVSGSTVVGGVVGDTYNNIVNCYFLTAKITINNILQNETQEKAVANLRTPSSAINCSPFSAEQKLTTKGETAKDTNGALVAFDANADLLEILNAGKTVYNAAHLAPLTPAADWLKGADGYPKHTAGGDPTPPEPDPDPVPDPTGWTYPTKVPTKPFAKGSGTVGAPFEISTPQELANMSYLINTANATYNGKDVFYKLTKDIVLNTGTITSASTGVKSWTAIGESDEKPFQGTFDGDSHTVSGIYINDTAELTGNFKGLFGLVGGETLTTTTVKNVGVINSYINGYGNTGGVVGISYGVIINCYNRGEVTGANSVGGVVGANPGAIINCYNTGKVSGPENVGGVVGVNIGAVSNCYNRGAVSGTTSVGGVIGYNDGAVANCYFLKIAGDINKDWNAVGANVDDGTVTNCSPFGADKKLTTAGGTATNSTNKVLVTFEKNADLLATLNLGKAKYNELNPTATQAADWLKGANDYPAFTLGGETPPTPPAGGGDSDSEPSISPEDIFWTRVITDLKHKDEPVVEFNCKYPRMSRSVLLALQEVDKTLNINLNGEKLTITSKQVKPLTFDKASYSVAELKALLEKPVITPTPTPTPTEKPTEPVVPEKPAANLTWLWILLAVIVVAGAVAAFVVIKRKKNDDNK